MIVLYWMTPDPFVVHDRETLRDVARTMREHSVRRLPVLDDEDHLCGIIGRTDLAPYLRRHDITKPLPDEIDAKLAEVSVREAMTPNPATCDANDYVENVCQRMIEEKVGAYPVLRRGHLVGIVSETDLLRSIVELTHADNEGKRITLRLPMHQEKNLIYRIVDLSRTFGLLLQSMVTHPILDESAMMVTIRVQGDRVDEFIGTLWRKGYRVVDG